MAKFKLLNQRQILNQGTRVARRAVLWTARDIRSAAKRSIKSGGKNPVSASYKTSKPGEAPRSHKGNLKNAIVYEKINDDTYLVGATRLSNSNALKLLEFGGRARSNKTYFKDSYVASMKQRRRTKTGTVTAKPAVSRPYVVATKTSRIVVKEYRKFSSRDAWKRASSSSGFQKWSRAQREIENASFTLAARPYMKPAALVAGSPSKVAERIRRAASLK